MDVTYMTLEAIKVKDRYLLISIIIFQYAFEK